MELPSADQGCNVERGEGGLLTAGQVNCYYPQMMAFTEAVAGKQQDRSATGKKHVLWLKQKKLFLANTQRLKPTDGKVEHFPTKYM